jgi:non-specific protein-tyrosine kinase
MITKEKMRLDVKWATRQRLQYIEIMAWYAGVVTRSDVARAFGLSDPAATKDLKLYGDLAPGNLVYNHSVFGFVPGAGFAAVFAELTPAAVLPIIAANLAVAMARAGKQVILVDTDLRRPALHRLFHHHNGRGVTTALLREPGTSLLEHMQVTKLDNLLLLPSGPLPSDPAAMLSSPRMTTLVAELKDMADVVIFDSPPLLAVADATLLAHISDATLMVALAGSTRSGALRRAGELLAQAGITLAGVVLNRAAKESGGYGYYYYYGDERRQQHGWWKTIFARGKEHSDHAGSGDAISADTAAAMALARAQARERLKAQMALLKRRRGGLGADDVTQDDDPAATIIQAAAPERRNGKGPH